MWIFFPGIGGKPFSRGKSIVRLPVVQSLFFVCR